MPLFLFLFWLLSWIRMLPLFPLSSLEQSHEKIWKHDSYWWCQPVRAPRKTMVLTKTSVAEQSDLLESAVLDCAKQEAQPP